LDRLSSKEEALTSILYETNLLKRLLETERKHVFASSGLELTMGYMPFIRRLAHKLATLQKSSEEVANFLDSIPEWAEFFENEVLPVTEREEKPLGSDPRGRNS
jgi:hypothetical protein